MVRKLFMVSALMIVLTSCASFKSGLNFHDNLKLLEANMSKEEVISLLGNSYGMLGGGENWQLIGYWRSASIVYELYFENGVLKEWHRVEHTNPNTNIHIKTTPETK